MKKILLIATAALMFAACTNDNGNDNGNGNDGGDGGNTEKTTYTVKYAAGAEGCDNMLFYDLKISYKNAEGEIIEETVTEYPFVKEITGIEAPFTAEMTPVYTLKKLEDITTDKETFKICGLNLSIAVKENDGIYDISTSFPTKSGLPLEKAYEYISKSIPNHSETRTRVIE